MAASTARSKRDQASGRKLDSFGGFFVMTTPTERELPITIDLPSSLFRQIGRVVAAHALVEWILNRIVYRLLRLKPVEGRIAVRDPRTTDRLDMITDLLTLNNIAVQTDTKTLREVLDKCYRERDELAHGVWVIDREAGKLFLRLSGGKWQPPGMNKAVKRRIDLEAREYTSDDAKETYRLIHGALEALSAFEDEIAGALAPLRKKSPLRSRGNRRRPGHTSKKPPARRLPSRG